VQAADRKASPVGSGVPAPRRPAFADGQMSWGDVAFDADLVANVLGDLPIVWYETLGSAKCKKNDRCGRSAPTWAGIPSRQSPATEQGAETILRPRRPGPEDPSLGRFRAKTPWAERSSRSP
jgi:hypothetical protein